MSGRVVTGWREGKPIVGYRKTLRRQAARRPLIERLHALNERQAKRSPSGWDVRVGFLLPTDVGALVASGAHGIGVTVVKDFVHVAGGSAEQCFQRAADFLGAVARRRIFTRRASIISLQRPGEHYGRHLMWTDAALWIGGGEFEPRIFHPKN